MLKKVLPIKVIIVLSAFIAPIISMPFIVSGIYNRKNYAIYTLAFLMGLFAIYFLPVADLYRHIVLYYELKDYEWRWFLDFIRTREDYLFYIALYVFGKANINFEFLRFLIVWSGYSIYFWIFIDYVKRNLLVDRKIYLLVFSIVFCYIPLFGLGGGIRFNFSTAVLIGGFYRIYILHDKKGYIWGIISCFIHFGQVPIFLLLCILNNLFLIRFKYVVLLFSLVLIIGGAHIISYAIEVLPISDLYKAKLIAYTTFYDDNVLKENSILTYIYVYARKIPFFLSLIYLLKTKHKTKEVNLALGVFLFLSLLYIFPIGERYTSFFIFVIFIIYVQNDLFFRKCLWYKKSIQYSYILIFLLNFYWWRMVLPPSRIVEYLFTPTISTIFHNDDPNTIFLNVDEEGTLIKEF